MDWKLIDRTINRAIAKHNEGVPPCGKEMPVAFALDTDTFTKVVHVSAIRFVDGTEVRLRRAPKEQWRAFA